MRPKIGQQAFEADEACASPGTSFAQRYRFNGWIIAIGLARKDKLVEL